MPNGLIVNLEKSKAELEEFAIDLEVAAKERCAPKIIKTQEANLNMMEDFQVGAKQKLKNIEMKG